MSTAINEPTDSGVTRPGGVGLGSPPVLADPADTVLSARGLVKTFGKVIGLDGVSFDLFPGEVLAVIGDNGAGKSTLIKAVTGAAVPDAGQVFLDGREVNFRTPQDARGAGIETVYQTLAVAPALDISANMFLGRERRRPGILGSAVSGRPLPLRAQRPSPPSSSFSTSRRRRWGSRRRDRCST
jgi:energy-coupling factor transporter ATP-binding protein EcfA2